MSLSRKTFFVIFFLLLLISASASAHNPQSTNKEAIASASTVNSSENDRNTMENSQYAYVTGNSSEFIIGLDNAYANAYSKLVTDVQTYSGHIVSKVSSKDGLWAVVVDVPSAHVSSFTSSIKANNLAKYVEPNLKFKADFVPNDPDWHLQWGPAKIEADKAWDIQQGTSSVLVAVVDTGVDWNHPDLASNYVPLGYDWVNDDSNPMDDNGHGTHCAGVTAAVLSNGVGIAGLAQVHIMAEKGLGSDGTGTESNLASAIIHAVDQGAKIISCSWGGYDDNSLIHDAVKYAYSHGVLVVAAAGNDASMAKHYPSAYDEVIAVTATDQNDAPASFTNFGNWVEVAAPGVDIYSTIWDNSYDYMSGTSMATPHVSGVAALIWSQFPSMTMNQVREQLRRTAQDLGDPGFDDYYGYGRINAKNSVEQAPASHDLLIFRWMKASTVKLGRPESYNIAVLNFGTSDEVNVQVKLLADGNLVDSAPIVSLSHGSLQTVELSWTPSVEHDYNITIYVVPVIGETTAENNRASATISVSTFAVALFQNTYPWGSSENEEVFAKYKIAYDVFTSSDFGSVDLSQYSKVVIPSDQDQKFYDDVNTYRGWFENYASMGGVLEIHAAEGWNNGHWVEQYLPGNIEFDRYNEQYVSIFDPSHPVVNTPNKITDDELDNWNYAIHGFFSYYPWEGSHVVIIDGSFGWAVWLEVAWGSGFILASSQTLEWGYLHQRSLILENTLLYRTSIDFDLAITNIETSKTVVGQGYNVNVNVTVANLGSYAETFNVALYAQLQNVIHDASLIGYWKFDEGSGTVAHDSSGKANDGRICGASWVNGKYGKGLFFDGVDDYVDCGNWLGSSLQYGDTITAMAWIRFSHIDTAQTIVSHGDDSYTFCIERGVAPQYWLDWKKAGWGSNVSDSYKLELHPDEWCHVAVVNRIGIDATFYINGMSKVTVGYAQSYNYLKNLTIGFSDSEGSPFNGMIDEVKIYNRTLSPEEIWDEYACTAYASFIEQQRITLEKEATTTLSFNWNTTNFSQGTYILCAIADVLPQEMITTNNLLTQGYIIVTLPGDVSGDFRVDGKDIARIAKAFNTKPGDRFWISNADIDGDSKVDGKDLAVAAKDYGKPF